MKPLNLIVGPNKVKANPTNVYNQPNCQQFPWLTLCLILKWACYIM